MKIHDGVSVDVYRNLHKNTWSIRSRTTGRVVGHSDNVLVRAAKFVVQPAGRKRVLQDKRKNVHAFVRGVVSPLPGVTTFETPCDVQVKYNPYKADHFYEVETGEAVEQASVVVLDTQGAWIQESASKGQPEVLKLEQEIA
jgi:hypothetical protein